MSWISELTNYRCISHILRASAGGGSYGIGSDDGPTIGKRDKDI